MNNFVFNHLNEIKKNKFTNPEFELRILLNHCSNNEGLILLNNFNLKDIDLKKFNFAFKRRMQYEPVSKIFNNKEFWSSDYYVNEYVLDPRPESEFLIDSVLKFFPNKDLKIKICDLGTGSGCLAITLAKIYNKSNITATDISGRALEVAKKNAKKHSVIKQIKFIRCDWISKFEKFDIIVANPPYLSLKEYNKCTLNIKNFEPKNALFAGKDGLDCYKKISNLFNLSIYNNTLFFIEIGKSMSKDVISIFNKNNFKLLKIVKDYQKINRILVFTKI